MINQLCKLASLFEKKAVAHFPPLMAEEISSWVKKIYLNELSKPGNREYIRKFDIDLEYLGINIESWPYDGIEVQLNTINKPEISGQFDVEEFKIYINLGKGLHQYFALLEIDNTVEHELAHMVQYLVMLVKKKKDYHKEWTPQSDFHSWYGKAKLDSDASTFDNRTYLDHAEFQPYLLNAVREFVVWVELVKTGQINNHNLIDYEITKKDFNIFVGNPKPVAGKIEKDKMVTFPFFQKLHDYDFHRWKKAVKDFWKLVEIYIDE